jgi:hypothetical protein
LSTGPEEQSAIYACPELVEGNVEVLIEWGEKVLSFFSQRESKRGSVVEEAQIEEKLGWIRRFRKPLRQWGEVVEVLRVTESFVREEGIYRGGHRELKQRLIPIARTSRGKKIGQQMVGFIAKQSLKAKEKERLLGSSEVIESVFGRLKRLEGDQAKSGFTGLLLSIGAMVSSTTREVIQRAMETVSTQHVLDWCKQMLGQSVQAKRREAFASEDHQKEQKWSQLSLAV